MSHPSQPASRHWKNRSVRSGWLGAVWLTGGQTVNRAVRFFLFSYLAHVLGANIYGDFIYAFRLVMVFTGIADFGLELIGIKLQSRYPKLHWEIAQRIITLRLGLATIALLLMVALTFIVPEAGRLRMPILVFGGMLYFNEVSFNWPFFASGYIEEIGVGNIVSGLVTLCIAMVFVRRNSDIYSAILSLVGGIAAGVFYMAYRYKRRFFDLRELTLPSEAAVLGSITSTIRDAAPIAVSTVLFRFYSSAIPLILGILLSTREAGIFDAANLAPQFVLVAAQMLLNSFILPIASKAYADTDLSLDERKSSHSWKTLEMRLGLGLIGIIALLFASVPIVAMTSDSIMRYGFGEDFIEGSVILVILSVRAMVGTVNIGYRNLLLASNNEPIYMVVMIGQIIAVVILGFLGIDYAGLVGGAYVLLGSELVALISVLVYLWKQNILPSLRITNRVSSIR